MPMSKLTLGPQGLIGFDGPCVLRDLQPGPGYCAAVAVLTDAPIEIDERDGSCLLDHSGDA
jgi:hypothetical protein